MHSIQTIHIRRPPWRPLGCEGWLFQIQILKSSTPFKICRFADCNLEILSELQVLQVTILKYSILELASWGGPGPSMGHGPSMGPGQAQLNPGTWAGHMGSRSGPQSCETCTGVTLEQIFPLPNFRRRRQTGGDRNLFDFFSSAFLNFFQ